MTFDSAAPRDPSSVRGCVGADFYYYYDHDDDDESGSMIL